MEAYSRALQQPEHVHVLLNHLPLTGLFVALLFLIAAVLLNHRSGQCASLMMIAFLALSAWPVVHFGEDAYDRVLSMSDDVAERYLKQHAELADRWIFLYYVTAAAAVAGLVGGWMKPKFLRPSAVVVALLTAASLVAGAVIADCGGKIRHREFRYGSPTTNDVENH
jgi:hypothetical protein